MTIEATGVAVTRLPPDGAVLVRAPAPPALPVAAIVDVRAGPHASLDGDRRRLPLVVAAGDERRRVGRDGLDTLAPAVVEALDGPAAAIRFGDRSVCRRALPAAAVDAIDRRLVGLAERADATLVTWTSGDAAAASRYDVVLG